MAKNKIFYKIVDVHHRSCSVGYSNADQYEVNYQLGNFVKTRDGTPLFVFKTLEAAQDFIANKNGVAPAKHIDMYIYECEVIRPRRIKHLVSYLSNDNIKNFWKLKNRRKSIRRISYKSVPNGTWVCDSVKLLRQVA